MTSASPMDGEGVRSTENSGDASWDGYERAIREGSRRYRPGKVCNRPQMNEREAGKPKRRQMDVFKDTATGRAATRLVRTSAKEPATHRGAAGKSQGGNAQAGLPLAGPRDATTGTQDRSGRTKGVRRAKAGRIRQEPDDRPERPGAMGDEDAAGHGRPPQDSRSSKGSAWRLSVPTVRATAMANHTAKTKHRRSAAVTGAPHGGRDRQSP